MTCAVALDRISKRYGATIALDTTSFAVQLGAMHALLGENGAGKSTVVKILSGILQPDQGEIRLFDRPESLPDRQASSRAGIETAFQEIPLLPDLTVTQNLLLPREPISFGSFLNHRASRREAERILTELELSGLDPSAEIRDLELSVRQKIEIARAISREPKILILDEPTAALSLHDVAWLGRRIRDLQLKSTTVLLVTHRMQEVREFCTHLSILRNGSHVGTFQVTDVGDDEVFKLIMRRAVEATFPPKAAVDETTPAVLSASDIAIPGRLHKISLQIRRGEIVGVAGLQGMGQLALFNALFGAERLSGGVTRVAGVPVRLTSPGVAIKAGIGLVPEDRKIQGLALNQTGEANASLPIVRKFAQFWLIQRSKEHLAVDAAFAAVNLHPRAIYQSAGSLSGGNQQKIVLAKWLLSECRLLLAYDPTRGVDVGTKQEIYALLNGFVKKGGAVLLYSTEMPELIGLCSRILVLYGGRIEAEFASSEFSEDQIGAAMLGASSKAITAGMRT
jgi:ribose transport system ATP-binding protein